MTEMSKNKIFYGWAIVAIATLALVVSNGLSIGGIPVFSEWIRNDLIAGGAISTDKAQTIVSNFGVFTFSVAMDKALAISFQREHILSLVSTKLRRLTDATPLKKICSRRNYRRARTMGFIS